MPNESAEQLAMPPAAALATPLANDWRHPRQASARVLQRRL